MTIETLAKIIVNDGYFGTFDEEKKYDEALEHATKTIREHLTSVIFDVDTKLNKITIIPIYKGE